MRLRLFFIGLAMFAVLIPVPAMAQSSSDATFSVQVSPSPLVSTVEPGQTKILDIQIRNLGNQTESLRIQPRSFTIDNGSESVKLDDTTPPEVTGWLSFSAPTFSVAPAQVFNEKVSISVPKTAGFSYSFALVISRQKDPNPTEGSRQIKGSLAVFTLLNVDRPGAKRELQVSKFTISKRVYEYLPAELSLQFKNTGNTIVQPYGNIFIQRGETTQATKTALATLPVNENHGYILPGSTRTLQTDWNDGFPQRVTTKLADGSTQTSLKWDWSKIANFRLGKYTAKIVAVYNDGQRDVPIEGSVSFWVIPWKIIGGGLLVLLLVLAGLSSLFWNATRRARDKRKTHSTP